MSQFREFTGKNLDEAIQEACSYFAVERSKLEIDIVSGGSTGIFGLVGKKKAVVKARPRVPVNLAAEAERQRGKARAERAPEVREDRPEREERREQAPAAPRAEAPAPAPRVEAPAPAPRPQAQVPAERPVAAAPAPRVPAPAPAERPVAAAPAVSPVSFHEPDEEPFLSEADEPEGDIDDSSDEFYDEDEDMAASTGPAPLDEEPEVELPLENPELEKLITEAVRLMVEPIVGEAEIKIYQGRDRIKVRVGDEETSGLLIGRDGLTLNALQYLLSRIVGKQWPEPVRVQLDTGAYRERQDDKLRKMAHFLASKARSTGRTQSTRPLSSYHRRVIHLALQHDETVQTRSKGEGPLKRVLILPTRPGGKGRGGRERDRER